VATAVAPEIGERFCKALASRDFAALGALFAEDGQLRGLVPTALREVTGPEEIAKRFELWFGDEEDLQLVEHEIEPLADRVRIRYRFTCVNPDEGPQIVEQQGYAELAGDKIAVLSLVCSGFRPRA
jgi:SnoaL-like domain